MSKNCAHIQEKHWKKIVKVVHAAQHHAVDSGSDQVVGENEKKEEKKHETNVQPRVGAPMHGVDFGKMTT